LPLGDVAAVLELPECLKSQALVSSRASALAKEVYENNVTARGCCFFYNRIAAMPGKSSFSVITS
ncbi:MAG: hypothetical protein K9G11_03210, partial [Rickettsiaceae bacterium]|nr:hypothetical protein [Rickettsiaceae bacterium]